MTLGKGMVSAALPAGGVVMSREIAAVMDRYRWETISTFAGHPVVMAAVVRQPRVADRGGRARAARRARRAPGPAAAASSRRRTPASPRSRARACSGPSSSSDRTAPVSASCPTTGTPRLPARRRVLAVALPRRECAKRGVALATAPPNTLRLGPPLTTTGSTSTSASTCPARALDELARVGREQLGRRDEPARASPGSVT